MLSTHVAPHPDLLVAELCDLLARPPEDPFAPEVVAVPTRGIERWLTQQIASGLEDRGVGDGICANVAFPSPGELVGAVLQALPGIDAAAWEGPLLTNAVLEVVDRHLGAPWMGLLTRYLQLPESEPAANRLAAAAKLARLFAGYARRRPQMIRAWAEGEDRGPDGEPLHPDDAWQPQLWRLVRRHLGTPSIAEVLPAALGPLRRGEVELDLPGRLSVYGLTAADPLDLRVLEALAAVREVHLFVLHPSPALWRETAPLLGPVLPRREEDPAAALPAHPLLAAWARDSRELQAVLAAHGITPTPDTVEHLPPVTLLERIQADIRANRPPSAHRLDPADRSVQVHVCHGARRQVEVARDAILHALAADPTLEPRDVVIMTPDLATFAPLLEAAFPAGEAAPDGVPDLRLRIADRSPAAVNPLVRFAAAVCDLGASRMEANAVRELVTMPVVQRRFGFDGEAAAEVTKVIDEAGIAWGFDADDRRRWGAGESEERTWRRGLDRALAGVFYADSPVRVIGGIAPLDAVEGGEAVPVGLLAQVLDRLDAARRLLATPRPVSRWGEALMAAVRLLASPEWGEEWQWAQLEELLAHTFPAEGDGPEVTLLEVRQALAAWTDDRPSPLHFRTGDITVCTLAPMRSVPYRLVCLLGMDDERFPRRGTSDGDDLLSLDERVGDHDRAAEDRQLLCDALLAAGDHLIVTYSGRDELTGAELPPAVPIAELCDVVAEMTGESPPAILTAHPLQSFSAANFTAGALGVEGPWGFDPMQLAGARALAARTAEPSPPPGEWPEPAPEEVIRLEDLIAFFRNPAQRFLRGRAGFTVPGRGEVPTDVLPVELGGLERWGVRDRILRGLLGGHELAALVAREQAADTLPPGSLGTETIDEAAATARSLAEAARDHGVDPSAGHPYSGEVAVDGGAVEGTVSADPGRALLAEVTASRIRGAQRLRAYVRLLFLTALRPEEEWRAVLIGRSDRGDRNLAVTFHPLAATPEQRGKEAAERLADLVEMYREGMRRPLLLPCETSYACIRALGKDRDGWALRKAMEEAWVNGVAESTDAAHRMLFPDIVDTADLLDSGIEERCRRLWGPVLALSSEKTL